jgi:integrase
MSKSVALTRFSTPLPFPAILPDAIVAAANWQLVAIRFLLRSEHFMGAKARVRVTKRVVDELEQHAQVWDAELKGFGVRRQTGRPYYFVSYRANGRRRWITLGVHGAMTPDLARKEALKVLGEVARGSDPATKRDLEKLAGNIEELTQRFLRDYATSRNKASSVAEYERLIRLHIVPALGPLRLNDVTRADIARWHAGFKSNPVAGNRALTLLKHMFNLAEKWGLRQQANPARLIDKYPEMPRERLLSPAEFKRLGAVLSEVEAEGVENPAVITCIRLLLLTGARLSEILKLRWDWVDFEGGALRLPDSKTGPKVVPLGAPALAVLAGLPRTDPYVCAGRIPECHFVGIQRRWRRIRAQAGLTDVRIHDLRHAYASMAAMAGDSLFLIGKALGHKQASTTERYMHLYHDPIRALADRNSKRIAAALSGDESAAVVALKG